MIDRYCCAPTVDAPSRPLIEIPPSPGCNFCVAIPLRDERETVEDTLASLAQQVDGDGQPLDPSGYEVIILANNCRDDSAWLARSFAARHPRVALHVVEATLPEAEAHVGRARRMVMDEACTRLMSNGYQRGIIATTDADTCVSPTWINSTRTEISHGADAVGGRITVDPAELATLSDPGLVYHLRDVGYRSLVAELEARIDPDPHDPWPRHFQHFGASLAVTAETYRQAGGLPVQPWLEDVAFYNALVRIDARIRHSRDVQVLTSARRNGRTGFGFAVQIGQWSEMVHNHVPMRVESAAAIDASIRARRTLRGAWRSRREGIVMSVHERLRLAGELGIEAAWLTAALARHEHCGALLQDVEHYQRNRGIWHEQWPLVDVREAIWDLRRRLSHLRETPSLTSLKEIEAVEIGTLPAQVS